MPVVDRLTEYKELHLELEARYQDIPRSTRAFFSITTALGLADADKLKVVGKHVTEEEFIELVRRLYRKIRAVPTPKLPASS